MKDAVFSGFRRAATLQTLLVPFLTTVVILINCIEPLLRVFQENALFEDFHIGLLTVSFSSDTLSFFLPILASLPFSGCFVDDTKSKYARFVLIRSNYCGYLFSRIFTGFLVGGLAILAGALITCGITSVVLIPMERTIDGQETASINGLVKICVLLFINGGFWSVVGMVMSTVMESKYIAYASPFVVYYLLVMLCERYFPRAYLIYPREWLNPSNKWPLGVWGVAIFLLELTTLLGLIFYRRGKRRLEQL